MGQVRGCHAAGTALPAALSLQAAPASRWRWPSTKISVSRPQRFCLPVHKGATTLAWCWPSMAQRGA
eukprot:283387-Chlamydomonas_euryale.AAC.4